jgi:uncharacterized protein (TIGR02099 family)
MLRLKHLTLPALTALVAVALLLSAVRLMMPFAGNYRDVLESALSQRLGYRVSVGALTLRMSGWTPRLLLDRVRLSDPGTGVDVFSLNAVELDLDLPGSFRMASVQVRRLTLVGAHLMLERASSGRLRLVGFTALAGDHPQALERFLSQGYVNLAGSEILFVDERRHGERWRLTDVNLQLRNDGLKHRLELSARPAAVATPAREPGADTNQLHLIAELTGPPAAPAAWDGAVHLSLVGARLHDLLPVDPLDGQTLDTQGVRLESWHRIRAGRLEQSLLSVDLSRLSLTPGAALDAGQAARLPIAIPRVHALTRVRPQASGWRVEVTDLRASVAGADLAGLALDLRLNADGALAQLGLVAPQLDLADVTQILRASPWPLPEPLAPLLAARPCGQVTELTFRLAGATPSQPDQPWRWTAAARLSGLGIERTSSLPGLTGFSARLSADQDAGELRLESGALALDFSPVFSERLMIERLGGRIDWRRDAAGAWQLSGHEIRLENADLAGQIRFDMTLPHDGSRPFLDLRAHFHDGNAAHLRSYLPVGIMKPDLVDWLTRSIVSGRITQADLVLRGPLADYPFRQQEGRFELLLAFEDLLLDYQPGWPPIASTAGDLRFLNQGLEIRVERGRIYDSALTAGETRIPDLWKPHRMLIHGEAEGPFSDGLRTLAETPLARDLGRLAKVLSVSGDSRLALDLDLPLFKHGHLGVAGQLTWPAPATLSLNDTPLSLSGLDGTLRFTEQSLDAHAVTARLWGKPLSLSIATEGEGNPETSRTRIAAVARTSVSELARRFPSPQWESLQGDLDWELAVSLHNRDVSQETPVLDYRLSSRLQGLTIDLPPPLRKSAHQTRALDLSGTLVPGHSMDIAGHLGDLGASLRLELGADAARLTAGRLRFGATSAPMPERPGLFLDGRLTELDLTDWMAWFDVMQSRSDGQARTGGAEPELAGVRLRVERLRLGEHELHGLALDMDALTDGGAFRVRADELAGTVRLPSAADRRPLTLALDRLDLRPWLTTPEGRQRVGASGRSVTIPSLDLRVQDLRWGSGSLGGLDLSLRNDAAGIHLSRLNLGGAGLLAASGEGEWLRSGASGHSRFELALEAADLSALLRVLDDQSALEAGPATAMLRLNWQGGFGDFDWPRAVGVVDLKVADGRLLGVEPGLGRLLGFMNFGALNRRLALDFTDLHGQGFAFEQMGGRIVIGNGQAGFAGFTIDGPAGKVIVAGVTDLTAQRFDQTVTVEPKLGSGVALASAVAGGPVVGAAVYLVDRVAGNPIDRLGRYRYRVTGPWSAPEFTRLGWEPLMTDEVNGKGGDALSTPEKGLFLNLE